MVSVDVKLITTKEEEEEEEEEELITTDVCYGPSR